MIHEQTVRYLLIAAALAFVIATLSVVSLQFTRSARAERLAVGLSAAFLTVGLLLIVVAVAH